MAILRTVLTVLVLAYALPFCGLVSAQTADPLPSWNEGTEKHSILAFVDEVTKSGSPGYVQPTERIATFDNDGNLWAEHPLLSCGFNRSMQHTQQIALPVFHILASFWVVR